MKTIRFVSLGCPKNLVDSEVALGSLTQAGYQVVADHEPADICMINTCCFVKDARIESSEIIDQAINLKKDGQYKKIVVSGCWPQREAKSIRKTYGRKIDALVGVFGRNEIVNTCDQLLKNASKQRGQSTAVITPRPHEACRTDPTRWRITPPHYAYLRIAEGCDNHCTYCVIPSLHGRYRSKPIKTIVSELQSLVRDGVREINIIAQDTTSYGQDLSGLQNLHVLLERISGINGLQWIRLLYTHPAYFTDELIEVISRNKKIVKYVDLPIQHISDSLLKKMGRHPGRTAITELIARLRQKINRGSGPELFLRTSVIVGFPGETENDFQTLLNFLKETKFERLGAFQYSAEPGTPAARLPRQVPAKVKQARFDAVMQLQQKIAFAKNKELVGRKLPVIIDRVGSKQDRTILIGRTYGDAPEVDGVIFLKPGTGKKNNPIKVGQITTATVTGRQDYDLQGRIS